MDVSDYAPKAEVVRVCRELGISDWSEKTDEQVDLEEARVVLGAVNSEGLKIPVGEFARGLGVELEHGIRYPDANVTNNHPLLTGKIVLAHLRESMDYYRRLVVAELEGDLLDAIRSGDAGRTSRLYRRLLDARQELDEAVKKAIDS